MPVVLPDSEDARQAWLHGDWARAREIGDTGCIIVRPDQHVCWRAEEMAEDPTGELRRVFASILGRGESAAMAAE